MKVLVACEFSGVVRDAFIKKGHCAVSCDLIPSESYEGQHIIGDVIEYLDDEWDMMIAHPPCTRLANSGVCWLHKRNLWDEMRVAATFFKRLLDANIPRIVVENPIPHRYALEIIGRKYDQIIHPWQFGHGETKSTCLWLKNLPKLEPSNIVDGRVPRIHYMAPSPNRGRERSRTYQGIADAMADQWG